MHTYFSVSSYPSGDCKVELGVLQLVLGEMCIDISIVSVKAFPLAFCTHLQSDGSQGKTKDRPDLDRVYDVFSLNSLVFSTCSSYCSV